MALPDPLKHAADPFGMVRVADQITGIDQGLLSPYVDYERQRRMMLDQMNQIGMLTKPKAPPIAPSPWVESLGDPFTAYNIFMRLRMTTDEVKAKGVEFGTIRKVGDRVDVVVLLQDKTLVMEDNAGLFPSDNFITKIRVLL